MSVRAVARWLRSLFRFPRPNRRTRRAGAWLGAEPLEARDVPSIAAINAASRLVPVTAFTSGYEAFNTALTRSLDDAIAGLGAVPLVGERLNEAVAPVFESIRTAGTGVVNGVRSVYASAATDVVAGIRTAMFNALGPTGANLLLDTPDAGTDVTLADVTRTGATTTTSTEQFSQLDVHLGQSFHVDLPLDLALSSSAILAKMPGLDLQLAATNGVRVAVNWDAYVGVGFDLDTPLGFYFDSTAVDDYGTPVPEFSATLSVSAAPPKDAAGNDVFSNAPGLSASAAVGVLQARATDGIVEGAQVSAENTKSFATSGSASASFQLQVRYNRNGTIVNSPTFTVSASSLSGGTTKLLLALNAALATEATNTANLNLDHVNANPFYLVPDFSANDDPTSTVGQFRYVLRTTSPDILNVTITGGDELGFAATQYEDGRSRSLGFASNATAVNNTLTAQFPAPASGKLARDVDFTLVVNGTNVPVVVRVADVNGTITALAGDPTTGASLQQVVQAELNAALTRAGLARNLTVNVDAITGVFTIARSAGVTATISLAVTYQTLETSRASITVAVDLDDEASAGATSGRIAFRDLAAAGSDAIGDLVLPSARADAKVRLHFDATAGAIDGYAAQGLGMAANIGSSAGQRGISLGLPGVEFDFAFDASMAYDAADGAATEYGDPYFYNVELDTGSLLSGVLKPVLGTVNKALGPVVQLIGSGSDLLSEPLPVVKTLFGTNASISQMLSNSGVGSQLVSFVDRIAGIPGYVNNLISKFASAGESISLGSWYYDTKSPTPGFKPLALEFVTNGVKDLAASVFQSSLDIGVSSPGLSIDLLTPSNALKLLSGETFNIVSYSLPTNTNNVTTEPSYALTAGIGFSVPPVTLGIPNVADTTFTLGGGANVTIVAEPISLRYDSTGLARIAAAYRAGATPDYGSLLDGVYLDISQGDEISVSGGIWASGGASLTTDLLGEVAKIVASASGSIYGRVQLQDPTGGDNKIRLREIFALTENFSNPAALLSFFHPTNTGVGISASFSISADVLGLNVTEVLERIGMPSSYSASADLSLQDIFGSITRRSFPTTPSLGTVSNGVLTLHTGPLAARRLVGDTNGDDGEKVSFTRINNDNTYDVTFTDNSNNNYTQRFSGVSSVVIAGGKGNDTLNASALRVPVTITSGGGDDTITGGTDDDILDGSGGRDVTISATLGGADVIRGGTGGGTITVGGAAKTVYAGTGANTITFTNNGHTLYTGAGSPVVSGGTTNTYILGTGRADITLGTGTNTIVDGPGSHTLRAQGNGDALTFTSVGGDDVVYGTNSADVLTATGYGDVRFYGLGGGDTLTGGAGDDLLDGGDGNDLLVGGGGTDTYNLGAGNNTVQIGGGAARFTSDNAVVNHRGGTGSDVIHGADARTGFHYQAVSGNDTVYGSNFDDTLAGGTGTDVLDGNRGSNVLSGTFADTLLGGPSLGGSAVEGTARDHFILDAATQTGVNLTTAGVLAPVGGTGTRTVSYKPGDTVEVLGGANADTITARDVTATLIFRTAGGDDQFTLERVTGNVTIDAGDGTNTVGNSSSLPFRFITGDVSITGGVNNDAVVLSDVTGAVTVNAGNGANAVTLSRVTGATSVTAGTGNDNVTLATVGGPVTVNAGDGTNSVTLTGAAAAASITTGTGADTITATTVAALTVASGSGNDTIAVTAATGALAVTPGDGADTVTMTTVSGASTLTLAGNDTVNLVSVSGGVGLTAAKGDVVVNVGSLTAASTFTLAPAADATTKLTANLTHATKLLTIAGSGTGTRNVTLSRAADATPRTYGYDGATLTTANQGNVGVSGLSALTVNLGAGADLVNVTNSTAAFDTTFNAGAGDDRFVVTQVNSSTTDANLFANGDTGTDTLTADIRGAAPNQTTANKFLRLSFDVESLVLDNSGYAAQTAWTFTERALQVGSVAVINTVGADNVRLVAGSNAGNTLTVTDTTANPQAITLGGSIVRIRENPAVVTPTPAFVAAAAGLTGYDSFQLTGGGGVVASGPRTPAALFTQSASVNVGSHPWEILAHDLNNDGKMDLVVPNADEGNTARLLFGNGDGTFQAPQVLTVGNAGANMTGVAAADFNKDDRIDLAFTGTNDDSLNFLYGTGTPGVFEAYQRINMTTNESLRSRDLVVGDMNLDGYADVVVVTDTGGEFRIRLGNGARGWNPVHAYTTGDKPLYLALGDFNEDGKPDVVTSDWLNDTISIHLNTTTNPADGASFAPRVTKATGDGPREVVVADVDGDGNLDIVVASDSAVGGGAGTLSTFLGNGNGTFDSVITDTDGGGSVGVAVADFDRDGVLDYVSGEPGTNEVAYSRGVGNGTLYGRTLFTAGTSPDRVTAADFNNDGLPDFAAAYGFGTTLTVMLQRGNRAVVTNAEGTPAADELGTVVAHAVSADGAFAYATLSGTSLLTLNLATGQRVPNAGAYTMRLTDTYAVSADNQTLYGLSPELQAVLTFDRDTTTGALTYRRQLDVGGTPTDITTIGFHAYVVLSSGKLLQYNRSSTTGTLFLSDTYQDSVLAGARKVIVSPDGQYVYVATAGAGGAGIVSYQRDLGNGNLTFVEFVRNGFGGVSGLGDVTGLASTVITDSGGTARRFVFAVSQADNTLVVLRHDPAGRLLPYQKLTHGTGGASGLLQPTGIRLVGTQLVVTSLGDGTTTNRGGVARFDLVTALGVATDYDFGFAGALTSLTLNTGSGADAVAVNPVTGPTTVEVNTNNGSDAVTVTNTTAGGTLNIRAGDDADAVSVTTIGNDAALGVFGGNGNDVLTLSGTGSGNSDGVMLNGGANADTFVVMGGGLGRSVKLFGDNATDTLNFYAPAGSTTTTTGSATTDGGTISVTGSANQVTHSTMEARNAIAAAAVTVAPRTIAEGAAVALSATITPPSGGTILSQLWDLDGDGVFGDATGAAPTVSWAALTALGLGDDGVYTVALQVVTQPGTGDPITSVTAGVLTVTDVAPTATISAPVATATATLPYTLNLSATDPSASDTITRWVVQWGDGTTDTYYAAAPAATHVYEYQGTYIVTATAHDDVEGTSDAAPTRTQVVTYHTLTATGSGEAVEGSPYTLDLDIDGAAVTLWSIDWTGGTNYTNYAADVRTVSHTYTADGTYTPRMRVRTFDTGNEGATNNNFFFADPVTVAEAAPTAAISGRNSVAEHATYTLALTGAAVGSNDSIASWAINWGDGQTETVTGNPNSWTHVYSVEGQYTITATATENSGAATPANVVAVSVTNVAPTVTLSPETAALNEGGTFTVGYGVTRSSAGADDAVTSLILDWGDGTTTTEVTSPTGGTRTHTYAVPGRFTVTARTVTPIGTVLAGDTVLVTVADVAPAVSIAAGSPVAEGTAFTLTLTNEVQPADPILGWNIVWGDGVTEFVAGDPDTATHVYADDGVYAVSAALVTQSGAYLTNTVTATITAVAPVVTVTGPGTVAEGTPFTISASAFNRGTGRVVSWQVDWRDGTVETYTGENSTFSHVYANNSATAYGIRVTATDDAGAVSAQVTKSVTVTDVAPTVVLLAGPPVVEGEAYTIAVRVEDPGAADVTTHLDLTWGDGITQTVTFSPVLNPNTGELEATYTHIYAAAGSYTVTAAASALIASAAEATATATILAEPPAVAATATVVGAAAGFETRFNEDTSVAFSLQLQYTARTPSLTRWEINWGDGSAVETVVTSANTVTVPHTFLIATPGARAIRATAFDAAGSHDLGVAYHVNDRPDLPPDVFNAPAFREGQAYTGNIAITDADDTAHTYGLSELPAMGTVTFNAANKTYRYTPHANANGTDTFQYFVADATSSSNVVRVNVTVTPVNDAPTLNVITSRTVAEDAGSQTVALGGITAGPTNEDAQTLTFAATSSDPALIPHPIVSGYNPATDTAVLTFAPTANAHGIATITVTVTDDGGTANGGANVRTRTFNITVTPVNDAPTLAAITPRTAAEDAAPQTVALAGITAGPADEAGQTLTFVATSSNPALVPHPVVSGYDAVAGAAVLTFAPAANANGTATITVTVTDDGGTANGGVNVFAQTFTVTVTPVNDAPVAAADAATTLEDTAVVIAVRGNDTDVDGDALTITAVSTPTSGTAVANADGTITYTPLVNFNGTATFTYTVSDGHGGTATATVSITVTPVNDAPTAAAGTLAATEDTTATGQLVAADIDSATLTYAIVTAPARGVVTLNASTGAFTYTPNADANGADSFTFRASDGALFSTTATVSIAIAAVNDAPTATAGTLAATEDTAAAGQLVAADTDSATLSYAIVTAPTRGVVTLNAATGAFTYTPNADANGTDSFTFRASDGALFSNTATVSIAIAAVNDAPTASNGSVSTLEDTAAAGQLVAADIDSATLTYEVVTAPTRGVVTLNASTGAFTYTPNADANGADSFTFRASDGALFSNTATVSITIAPVNDAPTATAGTLSVTEDTAAAGQLGAADIDSATLSFEVVTAPTRGVVTLNASTGAYTYTPNADTNGADSFTFRASDGALFSNTATVSIAIAPVNDAPTTSNGSVNTLEDTAATGTLVAADIDSATLSYEVVTAPTRGVVTLNASTGAFTYTPNADANGADSFTFRASDGALFSTTATVSIAIAAVNDAPTATAGTLAATEDTAATGTLGAADIDSATLTYEVVTAPTRGVVTLNASTGAYTYTPNADANGTDSFTFRASDGGLVSNTATVSIATAAVNDAPTAAADNYSTPRGVALSVAAPGVLGNDTDVDSPTLAVVSFTQPASGAVALAADGGLVYTPTATFTGQTSFTYTVADAAGATATATVVVTVQPRYEVVVTGGAAALAEGQTATFGSTVIDAAAPVTYAWTATRAGASAPETTGNAASFAFTPANNGTYTVALTATDGTSTATVVRSVTVSNVAPSVVVAGNVTVGEGGVAANTGTWADPSSDTVSVTASVGTVTTNANGTWSWALAVGDGPQPTQTVTVTATDSDGAAATTTFTYTIVNVAPTAAVSGPAVGAVGTAHTFTLTAADPSAADQAAGFTFAIDWDGDGVTDQTVTGPSGTTVAHSFADDDAYDVIVTATDRDGGKSVAATHTIDITDGGTGGGGGTAVVDAAGNLVVTGTSGNDEIRVRHTAVPGQVRVRINRQTVGTFTLAAGRVVEVYGLDGSDRITGSQQLTRSVAAFGGAGNDRITGGGGNDLLVGGDGNDTIHARFGNDAVYGGAGDDELRGGHGCDTLFGGDGDDDIRGGGGNDYLDGGAGNDDLTAGTGGDTLVGGAGDDDLRGGAGCDWIYGGAGDDRIRGGDGNDVLLGEAGNDLILGGDGRDLMIGGTGADRIEGNAEEDILIAGTTSYDQNGTALLAIQAAWTADLSYAARVASLTAGTGLAQGYRLIGDDGATQTVFTDDSADTLAGGSGIDWFFANLTADNGGVLDIVSDKKANELWADTDF